MNLKQVFNIPEKYKIIKIEYPNNKEMQIKIEPYKNKIAICSNCLEEHKKGYHGKREIIAQDLPVSGRKVFLHITKRRYLCPKDNKIYLEEIAWLKKKEIYR